MDVYRAQPSWVDADGVSSFSSLGHETAGRGKKRTGSPFCLFTLLACGWEGDEHTSGSSWGFSIEEKQLMDQRSGKARSKKEYFS